MKINFSCTFDGQNIKKDGVCALNFRVPYTEISEAVKLVMCLTNVLTVGIKVKETNILVGKVYLQRINVDRVGEMKITFDTDIYTMAASQEELRGIINEEIRLIVEKK